MFEVRKFACFNAFITWLQVKLTKREQHCMYFLRLGHPRLQNRQEIGDLYPPEIQTLSVQPRLNGLKHLREGHYAATCT